MNILNSILPCGRKNSWTSLCSLITVVMIWDIVAFSPAFAADEVWVFKQRDVVTGHFTTYISPHGLKLVNEQQKFRLVSAAPDWKMYMFNDASKRYFAVNPKDFKGVISAFVLSARGFNYSKVSFRKAKSFAINGVPFEKYDMDMGAPQVEPVLKNDRENMGLTKGQITVLAKAVIPPVLSHAICRFYCLPEQDKFILDLRATRLNKLSLMLTSSDPTKIPYDPSIFKHSVEGYTKGKSEYDVSVNVTEAIY